MKLKTKITLFASLFILIIVFLINIIIYQLFFNITTENEIEQLSNQTNVIMETLRENPDIPKRKLLQAFLPTNGMIRIVNEAGETLVPTLTKKEEFRQLPIEFSTKEMAVVKNDPSDRLVAVASKPIIMDDGTVATIQVVNYLTTLEKTMGTLLFILIITSIVTLIPTFIGSYILGKVILKPIKELDKAIRDNIQQEKWKTIDIKNNSHDELYEMEESFNALIVHLEEAFHKQGVFVSNASHELKTPISIVKSYAQLLKRRGNTHPDIFEESIDAIESEADRMEKLVNQMLLLAKRTVVVEKGNVDLVQLTKRTIATFINAYDCEIICSAQFEKMPVHANYDQIEQLIYILIDNALKYSEKEVKIFIFEQAEKVCLKVTDYGNGISEEDQKHIFDRFYRVDKARARKTGGTGLGLAIAKEIVTMHDEQLIVESKVDQYTIFTFSLAKWVE